MVLSDHRLLTRREMGVIEKKMQHCYVLREKEARSSSNLCKRLMGMTFESKIKKFSWI